MTDSARVPAFEALQRERDDLQRAGFALLDENTNLKAEIDQRRKRVAQLIGALGEIHSLSPIDSRVRRIARAALVSTHREPQ